MKVEVTAPFEYSGAIMASLCKRFGILCSTDESGGFCYIKAEVGSFI